MYSESNNVTETVLIDKLTGQFKQKKEVQWCEYGSLSMVIH